MHPGHMLRALIMKKTRTDVSGPSVEKVNSAAQ